MTTGATGSEPGTDAASQVPTEETAAPAVHPGTGREADEGAATSGEPEDGNQDAVLTDASTTEMQPPTAPATVVTTTVTTTDIVTGVTTTRTITSSGPAPWAPIASAHPHPVG